MKRTYPIQLTEMLPTAFSGFTPSLNVVLVYEDYEMGAEGKKIFDLIAKEAGGENAARLTIWRFDFFHSSELMLAVSRQAEEADVIIVAPRDPNHLPPQVKKWLERWPQRRQRATGALVAVFDPNNTEASRHSNAALLLWLAAERAGMDFFSRTADGVPDPVGLTRSASTNSLVPAMPTASSSCRQWGVNE